ncbi:hypothetical protein CFP56_031616 [Quercus suber]|uniref:Uncharacterized protein n=1 Tax=Quercus suber TaxID=58331 RepID=A0AAW0JLE6_QUESU
MEEGKRSDSLAQSRGVGSNVVGSTIFIKKPVYPDRATQTSSKEFKAQPSGFSRPEFTWHGRHGEEMIRERLDRRVANYEWLARFPTGKFKHLNCFTSNHQPILLPLDVDGDHQKWRWSL